jgi:protein-tyrosine-phosphatase
MSTDVHRQARGRGPGDAPRIEIVKSSGIQPRIARFSERVMRGLGRRAERVVARSKPLRHWLARRAQRDLRDAQRVLFLCYGNICRSPFAEHLARAHKPEWEVVSAGFHAEDRRASPANAVTAARGWKLDLATHASRTLDAEMVAAADAIVVFDWFNLRELLRTHPGALRRVHLLGSLVPDGPLILADPAGGDLATFEAVYGQVERALGVL